MEKSDYCFLKQKTKLCGENIYFGCIKMGAGTWNSACNDFTFSKANALRGKVCLTRRSYWSTFYCS